MTSSGLVTYTLRLALRDLRRSPTLAATAALSLALACAAFTASLGATAHFYPPRPALPAALYQVELPHTSSLVRPYRAIGYAIFNRLVADNDIPMGLTGWTIAGGASATIATGILAALYPGWRLSGTPVSLGADRA